MRQNPIRQAGRALAIAIVLAGGPGTPSLLARTGPDHERATFAPCTASARLTCVVDGDTFWYRGDKIRIADINTPETGQPRCEGERALGRAATVRLIELLNAGGFSLRHADRDTDRYGRKLRIITRGGRSLGLQLVDEGLAERWTGRRGNWCGAA